MVLISVFAGYYGTSDSESFSEGSRSGRDYLAEVCREWEGVAQSAQVVQPFCRSLPLKLIDVHVGSGRNYLAEACRG